MIKLLKHLESRKEFWFLFTTSVVFFFLRLPSFFEPYWYGDEGIYEVIGFALNKGRGLYTGIWDNKPPLLYVIYAIAGGDQPTVKIFSLVIGIFTLLAFFLLAKKLFIRQKPTFIATAIFLLLFAIPLLEANIANAENFMLLPIILAGFVLYKIGFKQQPTTSPLLLCAGVLLGLAFLFKIVAVFDLVAFIVFLIVTKLPKKLSWKFIRKLLTTSELRSFLLLILGFSLPLFVTIIYFAANGALTNFFQATFLGNIDYVGWKNTLFGIPQGLLFLKLFVLLLTITLIIRLRNRLTAPILFILTWLIFSLFNVYFSGRPYTHYALVLLPNFCLFIGLLFTKQPTIYKINSTIVGLLLIITLAFHFSLNPMRSYLYYQNFLQFVSNQKSTEAYQSFFDPNVPRDYALATFIRSNTTTKDPVFIWGNNPQIYVLSHKLPLGRYTVAYHVSQNNALNETQQLLNKIKPKYIISLDKTQPLPFAVPLYIMRYDVSGATIYERSF